VNFFEQQDIAQRNTWRLTVLLLLAVTSLILITTALFAFTMLYLGVGSSHSGQASAGFWQSLGTVIQWQRLATIAAVVLTVVLLGGLYKYWQLQGGGSTVAESLGGQRILPNTTDADERKILNVVEEMAIASGTAVPPVYILEDEAINAFAAGLTPEDAVIGVTRGCIRNLTRDELQGVVAHEFSHIFHGDMRLNMRLVAILNGILLLGLIGYFIIRGSAYRGVSTSRSRNKNQGGIMLLGVGLVVIGYAGTFFGNLIKAAVSRQREFLADASAVQFTRNPEGIAGALKKIGGSMNGSHLQATHSAEFSHMYFSQGVSSAFNALMATHPPLPERIRRIQPHWDGNYSITATATPNEAEASSTEQATARGAFTGAAALAAMQHIGQPSPEHIATAGTILHELGEPVRELARDPFSARGLVFGLLLDKDRSLRQQQLQALLQYYPLGELHALKTSMTKAHQLQEHQRLPLVDLAVSALHMLSPPQLKTFLQALHTLVIADGHINAMEWALTRIVRQHLGATEPRHEHTALRSLGKECQQVLSFVIHAGGNDDAMNQAAFERAATSLPLESLTLLTAAQLDTAALDRALDRLGGVKPLQKPQLLKAMIACIEHDGRITAIEAELFRAIADSLGCPVPPLTGQRV